MTGLPIDRLARAVRARMLGTFPSTLARGVSIDSRRVVPGQLFWALPGQRTDGHRFVQAAVKKGAVGAVVSHPSPGLPQLLVPDTRQALVRAARWYRRCLPATVIGITGSVGKTTTKEMLRAVLGSELCVAASEASHNNLVGLPLSVLNAPRDAEVLLLEHGTSEPGEIRDLTSISAPDWAVLTRIGAAHLSGLESTEGVLREKAQLIHALPRTGLALLNADDPLVRTVQPRLHCSVLWYGFGEAAADLGVRASWQPVQGGLSLQVDGCRFHVPARGGPFAYAALVAVLAARVFGLSTHSIQAGLAAFRPVGGRLRLIRVGEVRLIDDSYNANPLSLRACVALLDEVAREERRHRVLVLGDMLELGKQARAIHRTLGGELADRLDQVVAVGQLAAEFADAAASANRHCRVLRADDPVDAAALCRPLLAQSVIAVKGSRAMRLDETVRRLLECVGDGTAYAA